MKNSILKICCVSALMLLGGCDTFKHNEAKKVTPKSEKIVKHTKKHKQEQNKQTNTKENKSVESEGIKNVD